MKNKILETIVLLATVVVIVLVILYFTNVISFGKKSTKSKPAQKNIIGSSGQVCNTTQIDSCNMKNHESLCNDKYTTYTPGKCPSKMKVVESCADANKEHCENYYVSSGVDNIYYKCVTGYDYDDNQGLSLGCKADKHSGLCSTDSMPGKIKRNCKWKNNACLSYNACK